MIIRVEDKHGNGPYGSRGEIGGKFESILGEHSFTNGRPNPYKDTGYLMGSQEHCGFATWEQFIAWFTSLELRTMAKHGFYPVMIDVEPIAILNAQCIFERGL